MDGDAAFAKRCRDLQANEAGAQNDHLLGRRGPGDERASIRVSAKVKKLRVRSTRDGKPDRVGSHREQQPGM